MEERERKALLAQRPKPSEAELAQFFGTPQVRPDPQRKGWILPDPAWEAQHLVYVPVSQLPGWPPLANGQAVSRVAIHTRLQRVLRLTWAEVYRRGLHQRLHSFDGSHARRHMLQNPSHPLSLHARAAALDFDAKRNPYGLPHTHIAMNMAVVKVFEAWGWVWGGRWNPSDAMHFQWTQ